MAETIREMVIRMTMDAGGFRKSADEAKRQINLLNGELKAAGGASDGAANKLKLLGEKLNIQKGQVDNYAKAVEQAKTNLANASTEADKLAKARDLSRLETDLNKAKSAAKATADEMSKINAMKFTNFGKTMETIGRQVKNFGRSFSLYVSAPLAALGVGSYNAFKDFESAFAGVRKTVDATEETFTALQEGIIAMSETMPTSAEELAGIMEMAGQLGVPTENLLAFTKTMAMLGESTNIDSRSGAADLARFMNITKSSWSETDKLGSVLVDLGNNFATTESEILAMSTRLAAAGTLTGYSATEIMGLAAAMSSMGIEADAGGTAAGKLMKEMQLAAETGNDAAAMFAKVMGTDTTGFTAAFKTNAAQSMIDFFAGLASIDESGASSVVAQLDEMGITEVRMSNMVATGAANVELYKNATTMAAEAYDDGAALMEEANKRYATTESQDAMMYNKMQNNMADAGENIAEAIDPIKKKIDELLESFGNLSEVDQNKLIGIAGALIILGPAISGLGTAFSVFGKASGGIGTLIQNKDKIVSALAAIAASPVAQFAVAAGAILGLAYALDSIPTDAERILSSLANIQIKVDEDSKNKTLAAIAEVKAAADALSGEKAQEYAGTSAAVAAGYGTETMFGQALEYERAKAEKQVSDVSAMYSEQIGELNKQIGEAVQAGDDALATELAGQRDIVQTEWDGTVQMARTAYTEQINALVNGMMLAQPEARAAMEKAAKEYDLLAALNQIMSTDAYRAAADTDTLAYLNPLRDLFTPEVLQTYFGTNNFDQAFAGAGDTLVIGLRDKLLQSLTESTALTNEGGLAYTLINDLLSAEGTTDMLDFTQLQGAFDGAVETLDFKQAVQKAKDSGDLNLFGQNLTQGLADGVTTSAPITMQPAANAVKDTTLTALRTAFDMHSPARIMIPEGMKIPAGLAEGMNTGANLAYAAMAVMRVRLVSEAAMTARMMSAAFAQNLNLNPTASGINVGAVGGASGGITFGDVIVQSKTDAEVMAYKLAKLNQKNKAGYGS